ncbi:hypothetical protein [Fictibacillus arsenicus]|uniref:Uncharacterized protein n=1 Tax=Fictibacillus arsenicus TaxID=255247 RepID=A0A1V3GD44_9BACL|nr:hypothetical protein [Fictibacillus arsenicus]OOE14708.1 hypothetical protein UN64_05840 [Fictibacillus arsenicus]
MIINKKIRHQLVPYSNFPNPFRDEVAEKAELEEADRIVDENGEQVWLKKKNDLPSVFGKS